MDEIAYLDLIVVSLEREEVEHDELDDERGDRQQTHRGHGCTDDDDEGGRKGKHMERAMRVRKGEKRCI